jgi:hypothetical protein
VTLVTAMTSVDKNAVGTGRLIRISEQCVQLPLEIAYQRAQCACAVPGLQEHAYQECWGCEWHCTSTLCALICCFHVQGWVNSAHAWQLHTCTTSKVNLDLEGQLVKLLKQQ